MDEMINRAQTNRQNGSRTLDHMQGHPMRRETYKPNGIQQPVHASRFNSIPKAHLNNEQTKKKNGMQSERIVKVLDKIVAVCIFMLFFGLPLFFVNLTYQGISFEKQYYFFFWIFVSVIAWAIRGILGGTIEIRRTSFDIPLGIFWIVSVLATIFSVDKYHSFFGFFGNPVNGLISLTSLILAYYLIVSYITKKRAVVIWWAIVVSGSIVTIWSFLTTMNFIPASVLNYIIPSLAGTFTSLALFLAMMLPIFIISFSLFDLNKKKVYAKIIAGIIFIISILDLLTLSILFGYVLWYVVIISIALLLVFTISRSVRVSQTTSAMTAVIFFVLIAFFFYGQPVIQRTQIQPEALLKYNLSFDIAKEAIKNKPTLGSGPSTYGYNFSLYRSQDLNQNGQYDARFFSDRGVLLESVSTIGIIGTIALVVVLLSYIGTAVHAFMHSKDEEIKVMVLGLFIASIIASLYILFWSVDVLIILYGVLLASVALGLLRDSLSDSEDSKLVLSMLSTPQNALSFAFLSILVAVGIIFGFVTLGKMFMADVYAGSALKARVNNNFEESSERFKRAVALNEKEGRYFTIISQYELDLANIELAKGDQANKDLIVQHIQSAVGTAFASITRMPNDVLANEVAGFIYENSGGFVDDALGKALEAYSKARKLEPQNPNLDIAIGKLKLLEAQSKDKDATKEKNDLIVEAKQFFEEARDKTMFDYNGTGEKFSLFSSAYYYISVTEEALGNVGEAIDAMSTAFQISIKFGDGLTQQQIISRQVNYGFNLARLLQVRGTDEDNKNSEKLLLKIIGINDQEINSHLTLGLLYERTGRKDEALVEYKKILAILPDNDEKARENIQGLIDTIEQGGNNVDINERQRVNDGIDAESEMSLEQEENTSENVEKTEVLVISGRDSEDTAEHSRAMLTLKGYDVTVRNEDRDYEDMVIMYDKNIENEEIQEIVNMLDDAFDNVSIEQNDQETAIYNYDIVVIVGKSSDILDENIEE